MHKSFASLSSDRQKYANMLLNDINTGDINLENDKTFMDYILEYESKAESDQIKKVVNAFGINENLLRKLMSSPVNENNLNEFGRYDELYNSRDIEKATEYFEKLHNKKYKKFEINRMIDNFLRDFILNGGFDIENYK